MKMTTKPKIRVKIQHERPTDSEFDQLYWQGESYFEHVERVPKFFPPPAS